MSPELHRELLQRHIELKESLTELNVTLAKVETDVRHHILRTENLENKYDALTVEQVRLDRQLSRWAGATAISGWIVSTIIAVVAILVRFF